jgi:hypothetical protein
VRTLIKVSRREASDFLRFTALGLAFFFMAMLVPFHGLTVKVVFSLDPRP